MCLTCQHVLGTPICTRIHLLPPSDDASEKYVKQHINLTVLGSANECLRFAAADVAIVVPRCELPLKLNTLSPPVPVTLECWYKEVLVLDTESLKDMTVFKQGISSGRVVNVSRDMLYIVGKEVTPFSIPGDSGSLFVEFHGRIVGIVAEIEYMEEFGGEYCTKVIPFWEFRDWLIEEAPGVVHSFNCD